MKILLIDDEESIAFTLKLLLENQGHELNVVSDGESGINAFKTSLNSGNPFDLVITDYRMPDKDGAEVISELLALKPDQKIILITAYARDFARSISDRKDGVYVLVKPFELDALDDLIKKIFAKM
jgi:DNA-binding response OmpR family regulator